MECSVCLSPTAGIHYQVTCCRACAAFFRRTIQGNLRYKCCKKKMCDITFKNRFSCRFCRMKKCVSLGMTMTDDPSNSFDFHLDTSIDMIELEAEKDKMDEFYTVENTFANHEKFYLEFKERIVQVLNKRFKKPDFPFSMTMCQQIAVAYAHHSEKWPNCKKEKLVHRGIVDMNKMICDFCRGIEYTAEFCMEIKEFTELPFEQRILVFKHFAARFLQMYGVFVTVNFLGHDVNDSRLISGSGQIFDFDSCAMDLAEITNRTEDELRGVMMNTEKQVHTLFIQPYKRLYADEFENHYLVACAMWNLEGVEGLSPEATLKAQKFMNRLSDELSFYYKHDRNLKNYASRLYKMQNLLTSLDRIVEMRQQDSHMSKTFQLFKIDVHLSEILGKS